MFWFIYKKFFSKFVAVRLAIFFEKFSKSFKNRKMTILFETKLVQNHYIN